MDKIFENRKFVILDGAMGTYLDNLGFKGITPELANIERPEIVELIHTQYCESGAEIVLTNTFGANRRILSKKKLEDKFEEIIYKGVEICLKVREKFKNILIAGDIGPLGELLKPYGVIEKDEVKKSFYEVGMVFKKSGVDFLVLETFQDIEELKIAYETLRENTSFFIIPCLTFTYGREYRTLMGQTIEEYVKWALDNKVSIIGSNCGLSSEEMTGLVRIMRELSDLKLWIKPNAGKPQIQEGKIKYQEGIEEFTENCKNMVKNGVKFIGGCCGTTPSYIKKLKEVLINFYPDIKS